MGIRNWEKINPGTVLELTRTGGNEWYVFDGFLWRKVNARDEHLAQWEMSLLCGENPANYTLHSEGVPRPIAEPQGIGAVVDVEYNGGMEIRWVRVHTPSGAAWRAEGGGLSSWSGITDGKITVRHEGWDEQ